jgi:glycosyltransferase involved in cell wall biosynthesis
MASFADRRGQSWRFLSLNDPPDTAPFRVGLREVAFSGFGRSKLRFLRAAWSAARNQPSLIFALHPHLAPVVAAMKPAAPSARTAIFAHGLEVWTPLPLLRRGSLRLADLVFAPSADTARQLAAKQGLAEERIRRLAWSLGPEFDGGAGSGSANGPVSPGFPHGRVILTVGRWDAREAYKGVDHLISVLPQLLASVPDVHLVAIGSGTDLPRLRRLAQESGAGDKIHFLSSLPQEQLAPAYEACEVFALPSRGEGFGLVFLEAMSHGKPVIGGAHGGTPDVIDDGTTGYLVEYGNLAQLRDRLRHLLTDETARRSMGAQALQRVCRDFTFDCFSRNLDEALEPLLAQSPAPAVVSSKRY